MHNQSTLQTLRLSMTCDEWKLVDMALAAYSHNTVFRTVHKKLDAQVSTAKVLSKGAGGTSPMVAIATSVDRPARQKQRW